MMSFEEVWPKHKGRIRAFLRSRISNSSDVDDLLQEISIRVLNGLPSIKNSEKTKAWIFQIAHHAIIDYYKKSAKERRINADDLWYTADDSGILKELESCVEPFVNVLHPEMASILVAIDIDGVSQKDYAHSRNLPYSTLKSRLKKARLELRSRFEDCCYFVVDLHGSIIDYNAKSISCEVC